MTITDNFMELVHVKLLALYDTCLTAKGEGSCHLLPFNQSTIKLKKKKKQQYLSVPQNEIILNS